MTITDCKLKSNLSGTLVKLAHAGFLRSGPGWSRQAGLHMVSLQDAACGEPTCSDRAGNVTSTTAEAAPIWHAGHTYKGSIRSPSPRLASLFSHLPLPRLPPPLVFSYHFIGNRSGLPSRLVPPPLSPCKGPPLVPPFFTCTEDSRQLLPPSSLLHTDRQGERFFLYVRALFLSRQTQAMNRL